MHGWINKTRMIGKAYFVALIIADHQAKIQPNSAETYHYQWVKASQFLWLIQTNSPEKRKILYQALISLSR